MSWARGVLPAPTLASRQWAHALSRRCREPARVDGFIEPASSLHHILMAPSVGFRFEARELGTGKWREHSVQPGELCVAGAGCVPTELCWESQGKGRTLDIVELYIDPGGFSEGFTSSEPLSIEPCWRVLRDPMLMELLRGIAGELDRPESDQDSFGDLATTLFAVQLQRAHGVKSPPEKPRRGGLTPLTLRRVREYVAAQLDRPIRLQQLAAVADLSAFHFSRAFKASTGLSPHAYLLHCRIAEAKRLLSSKTIAVADVARRTGFTSTGQLSARFRASTGMTPSAFRSLTLR